MLPINGGRSQGARLGVVGVVLGGIGLVLASRQGREAFDGLGERQGGQHGGIFKVLALQPCTDAASDKIIFGAKPRLGCGSHPVDLSFPFVPFITELSDGARQCTMPLRPTEQHIIFTGGLWPVLPVFPLKSTRHYLLSSCVVSRRLFLGHPNRTSTHPTIITRCWNHRCRATHRLVHGNVPCDVCCSQCLTFRYWTRYKGLAPSTPLCLVPKPKPR